jgi:hypothetical protein
MPVQAVYGVEHLHDYEPCDSQTAVSLAVKAAAKCFAALTAAWLGQPRRHTRRLQANVHRVAALCHMKIAACQPTSCHRDCAAQSVSAITTTAACSKFSSHPPAAGVPVTTASSTATPNSNAQRVHAIGVLGAAERSTLSCNSRVTAGAGRHCISEAGCNPVPGGSRVPEGFFRLSCNKF